jgi:hypothetical protein
MPVLVNTTNILVTGNYAKIPATGNTKYQLQRTLQKYQSQGTIQNTSYKEQHNILVTENNTAYQLQGTIQNTS